MELEETRMSKNGKAIEALQSDWQENPRWQGVKRAYDAQTVLQLRGSLRIEHTLATRGATKLWETLNSAQFIRALGAMTGNQAIEQVQAGLKGIYVSGWQVAADANTAGDVYPDQSLYPADAVPGMVKRINRALQRADQVASVEGRQDVEDWFVPIVADAEAGFGGNLNAYEIMKGMIEAGAAGVHFEDQQSSLKKCGHMGGKVLVPTKEFVAKLHSARLAADVAGVPTVLVARTDADAANLITSDIDPVDRPFLTGRRTNEGFFEVRGGIEYAIARSLQYAPYADVVWCETSRPDIEQARAFARGIHDEFPGKILAYNCSPSFNWEANLSADDIATFQEQLNDMGYKFQFVTLAGFHALNASMFNLARAYRTDGMKAYSQLQQEEFAMEREFGYKAVKHQSFVGAGFFDLIQLAVTGGESSTTALTGSTEEDQF
jgi:isocitrate lyase